MRPCQVASNNAEFPSQDEMKGLCSGTRIGRDLTAIMFLPRYKRLVLLDDVFSSADLLFDGGPSLTPPTTESQSSSASRFLLSILKGTLSLGLLLHSTLLTVVTILHVILYNSPSLYNK